MRTAFGGLALSLVVLTAVGVTPAAGQSATAWPSNVFAVGAFSVAGKKVPGNYSTTENVATIQAAVDAAQVWAARHTPPRGVAPDTYVLLAPGDYKTVPGAIAAAPPVQGPAGVLITGANVWLVGMDRNSVIVDGTHSGPPCSTSPGDQVFGPASSPSEGLNGVMVWQAAGSWVENLTVCNFLDGSAGAGNEIWWNGGANSGKVFVDSQGGYVGKYLTATSTYFGATASNPEATAATYGIFSSNWDGGLWDQTYASNFNDSGYYIGACQDECNQRVNHAWSEYNALGYSGSNSGGTLVVEHSQFDNNEDGFDTNSQNGDNPPPQDGACPPGASPPIPGVTTCWVFYDNYVHDNNNPDVPTYGSAAAGPVGTGMSLSGARDDTIKDNTFVDNDAWGTILVPYPDSGPPCTGGTQLQVACWFDEYGDAVIDNTYAHNGSFGNPSNGDIAATNLEPGPPDCFSGNQDENGLTTSPPLAEVLYPACNGLTVPPDVNAVFTDEVACDSDSISIGPIQGGTVCPPKANYPRQTQVVMHPLPGASSLEDPSSTTLASMPAPCQGVPANPWCPSRSTGSSGGRSSGTVVKTSGAATASPRGSSGVADKRDGNPGGRRSGRHGRGHHRGRRH